MSQQIEIEEEVQQLAWALVDEFITPEQASRLQQLLTDEEAARQTYVECMQMHANLHLLLDEGLTERLEKAAREAVASSVPIAPLPGVEMIHGEMPLPNNEPVS